MNLIAIIKVLCIFISIFMGGLTVAKLYFKDDAIVMNILLFAASLTVVIYL